MILTSTSSHNTLVQWNDEMCLRHYDRYDFCERPSLFGGSGECQNDDAFGSYISNWKNNNNCKIDSGTNIVDGREYKWFWAMMRYQGMGYSKEESCGSIGYGNEIFSLPGYANEDDSIKVYNQGG